MQFFVAVIVITLLSQVLGHSYVTSPISRGKQVETNTGCRGPACLGPCEVTYANRRTQPTTVQRGDVLTIKWPRNNHAGGFIRFAWAPTSLSDIHAAFDAHVTQISCHETGGCRPDDASNPNGGDSNPADGSRNPCQTTVTVPLELVDGDYTLQWAWFGGAFALGDYYSCVDYKVIGGEVGYTAPKFVGGDFSYPGQQKCKFFNTDRLHRCVNEPCDNPVFASTVAQSGAPFNFPPAAVGSTSTSSTSSRPSTPVSSTSSTTGTPAPSTPVSSTSTSTTGSRTSTSTTGSRTSTSTSSTTGSTPVSLTSTSSTTARPSTPVSSTSTTGSPVPSSSTSTSGSINTEVSTTACAVQGDLGNQRCLENGRQYQTCSRTRDGFSWATAQSCQTGLACHEHAPNVYCY